MNEIKVNFNATISFWHNDRVYTVSTETSEVDHINRHYPLNNECKRLLAEVIFAEARDINEDVIEVEDSKLELCTISAVIAYCLKCAYLVTPNHVVLTNGIAYVTSVNVSILQEGEWVPIQCEEDMTVRVVQNQQ